MTPPKKPSRKTLDRIVKEFNKAYPVGTEVMLRKDSGEVRTRVKLSAYIMEGHSAVAGFENVSGCYSIEDDRVRPVEPSFIDGSGIEPEPVAPAPKPIPKPNRRAPLPIVLVDVPWRDRQFIISTLNRFGFDCSEDEAESLRRTLNGKVPDDMGECFEAIRWLVQVDWDKCPERLTDTLASLASRYTTADDLHRQLIEKEILLVTSGLAKHPDNWNLACLCNECATAD